VITNLSERKAKKVWPDVCLMSEEKFGHRAARLYPFFEKTVQTPEGPGTLHQVHAGEARVVLKRAKYMKSFPVEDITPYEGWMS
jgi:hypothetical protein